MKCPACHFDNPADTKFCGNCAAPLASSKVPLAPPTETFQMPIRDMKPKG